MIFADGLSADLCSQLLVFFVAFSDWFDNVFFSNIVSTPFQSSD
ncbi:hypothetical protein GGR02_002472 [Anoxybacillus voinovskiensis]|uniref:Uncharacterized protein n=1 Tax=Anoxybacteroides voinovskiense TaxID=230470 RepID=A0A840DSY4_9BACL|nr:hypothetical protein [Anoxybacillus voinovskiensis]MBB4074705.1 hypothetical protein [Anoxybacillus voinovskiensis]